MLWRPNKGRRTEGTSDGEGGLLLCLVSADGGKPSPNERKAGAPRREPRCPAIAGRLPSPSTTSAPLTPCRVENTKGRPRDRYLPVREAFSRRVDTHGQAASDYLLRCG